MASKLSSFSRGRLAALVSAALLTSSLAACSSSDSGGSSGAGKKIDVTFTTTVGETSGYARQIQWLMDRVTELTDGEVTFSPHYNAELVPGDQNLAAMQDGRADMAFLAPVYTPAEMPLSQAVGIPFVSMNPGAYAAAMRDMYSSNEAFHEEFESQGLHLLQFFGAAASVIVSNEPLVAVEDLDGLKVRAIGLEALALDGAGADVTAIDLSEALDSLERGLLDASGGTSMDVAASIGLTDVTKYMVSTGNGGSAMTTLVLAGKFYDSLSEEQQAAFDQAGEELYDEAPAIAKSVGDEACKDVKAKGLEVAAWDDSTIASWKAETQPLAVQSWLDTTTDAGVDEDVAQTFYDELVTSVEKNTSGPTAYDDPIVACAAG